MTGTHKMSSECITLFCSRNSHDDHTIHYYCNKYINSHAVCIIIPGSQN